MNRTDLGWKRAEKEVTINDTKKLNAFFTIYGYGAVSKTFFRVYIRAEIYHLVLLGTSPIFILFYFCRFNMS